MTKWGSVGNVTSMVYRCGWCGERMASNQRFSKTNGSLDEIRICSHCDKPTIFISSGQVPGANYGIDVNNVPNDIGHLYDEARRALGAMAPTASVMASRKILFNLAVNHAGLAPKNDAGFAPGFRQCVEHLMTQTLPKSMEPWLNVVKDIGNEANHDVKQAAEGDAKLLIDFTGQILRVLFEMPAMVPTKSQS